MELVKDFEVFGYINQNVHQIDTKQIMNLNAVRKDIRNYKVF